MIIHKEERAKSTEEDIDEYIQQASGNLPDRLTHDPTQGRGTAAWQLSLRHSMQANAKERRN